ncbi:MAG TPA: helix-turn-helix domain-containing protein [Candidatus Limnocylindrales bacterium]
MVTSRLEVRPGRGADPVGLPALRAVDGGAAAVPIEVPLEAAPTEWLAMREATLLLGVSPATLRRWADAGQVPTFTTPGGHRRFDRAALLSLLPLRQRRRQERTAGAARRTGEAGRTASGASCPGGWLAAIPDAAREPLQGHGRRISNALVAYLEAPEAERAAALEVARQAATAYGWIAGSIGASVREAIETFQGFRVPFVRELAATACSNHLDGAETSRLLMAGMEAMDDLLEVSLRGHEVARPRARAVRP